MKQLWIDDVREPGPDWVWAKTAHEGLGKLAIHIDDYERISFDHDLGDDYISGYDLLVFIEEWVRQGLIFHLPALEVHSANPVGYQRMVSAIEQIQKAYTGDRPYWPMRTTRGMDYEPTAFFMEDE